MSEAPVFNTWLAIGRLVRVLGVLLSGWWTVTWRFPNLSAQQRKHFIGHWAGRMLNAMGLGLEIQGNAPSEGPLLVVSNHVSWVDIVVLLAVFPCRFVAKAQVKHWPALGKMATAAGTFFIERDAKRDVIVVLHHMVQEISGGGIVAIFPESTTSDGNQVFPFHANLFQAAISCGAPIQSVALAYGGKASEWLSPQAAYLGDETLMGSLWRMLKMSSLTATVVVNAPLSSLAMTRRQCAGVHGQWVATNLARLRQASAPPSRTGR